MLGSCAADHPNRRDGLKASDSVGRLLGHTADDPILIAVANSADDSIMNFIQIRLQCSMDTGRTCGSTPRR